MNARRYIRQEVTARAVQAADKAVPMRITARLAALEILAGMVRLEEIHSEIPAHMAEDSRDGRTQKRISIFVPQRIIYAAVITGRH